MSLFFLFFFLSFFFLSFFFLFFFFFLFSFFSLCKITQISPLFLSVTQTSTCCTSRRRAAADLPRAAADQGNCMLFPQCCFYAIGTTSRSKEAIETLERARHTVLPAWQRLELWRSDSVFRFFSIHFAIGGAPGTRGYSSYNSSDSCFLPRSKRALTT